MNEPMIPIVRLRALRKSYGEGTPIVTEVLHGIDLDINGGEFVSLVGPSGSGKSTLLNMIGLLEKCSAGEIAIGGVEATSLEDADLTRLRGRMIGFVFQFHHLIPAFSALENVIMPGIIANGAASDADKVRALELLDQVGLSAHANKRPAQLSGGQQQRVAIARALLLKPRLILADEPTGNLDTQTSNEIFALLREFNRLHGSACLLVTHDPALAARCDRQIELVDGQIV